MRLRSFRDGAGVLAISLGVCAMGYGAVGLSGSDTSRPSTSTDYVPSPSEPRHVARPAPRLTQKSPPRRGAASNRPPTTKQPQSISIPRFGIQASIVPTGLGRERELVVPDPQRVGWYVDSAVPGEVGPSVLVGHKDDQDGPAVFYGLGDLQRGDTVIVDDTTWTVDRLQQVSADAFPTADVYGATATPQLRLLTCGGEFDHEEGAYEDNLIVYAHLAET